MKFQSITCKMSKRKADNSSQKDTPKKRLRINQQDSKTLVDCYAKHEKNWRPFFRDPEVVDLKYDEEQVKQHIRYLTRRGIKNNKGFFSDQGYLI